MRGQVDRTRTGWSCAGSRRQSLPASIEIFDTTLRDGAQFEGISLTVEDKLKVAEQLDWLGVAWIEGGYPQANPKDEEFFRRAVTRAPPRDGDAGGLRLHPAARRQGRRRPDPARRSSTRAPPPRASSARAGTSTCSTPSAPPSTRAWRWSGRAWRSSRRPACGCSSTPSTSSTATRPTPSTPCACWRRPPPTAPTAW